MVNEGPHQTAYTCLIMAYLKVTLARNSVYQLHWI